MGRILAIDYGRRRIGLALSDPLGLIAQPHGVLAVRRPGTEWTPLVELCWEWEVRRVVVGLPLDADGREGPMAEEARRWSEVLARKLELDVVLRDERFSSTWAERTADELELRGTDRNDRLDALAAQAILEDHLRETGR